MDIEKIFNDAKNGDDYAISNLKKILQEGKDLLENLYYDGNKEHAVGKIILRKDITAIEDNAFKDCEKLEEIILPDGLISIGASAFSGCKNLKEINLPESLTSIGDFAFCACTNLKEINLPEGLTSIGRNAFCGCSSLKEIKLPKGLISIGDFAFEGCSSLKYIDLPYSVTSIGGGAFYGCESLKAIWLHEGLTTIEDAYEIFYEETVGTFENCKNLETVNLPESLTSIGSRAFSGCKALKEIKIPDSVTSIGGGAFYDCANLKEINLPEGLMTIEVDVSFFLTRGAFENCERLEEIKLPDSVTTIEPETFRGCANLMEIFLSEGLTEISEEAFRGCKSLEEIHFPDALTSIGRYAFYGCTNLTEVKFSENLTSIGECAFNHCGRLKTIYYHKKTEELLRKYFIYRWDDLEKIVIDEQENSYYNGKRVNAVGTITLREDITSIENDEFRYCGNLEKVILPKGVTSIGERAFLFCKKLKEINLPEGLTSIGYSAFLGCESLEKIFLPESLRDIGYNAFSGCKNLKKIIYDKKTEELLQCRYKYGDSTSVIEGAFGDKWNEVEKIVVAKRRRVILTDLNNDFVKFAQSREIKYLVHFTRVENLPNISRHGLLTRKNLDEMSMEYAYNDDKRLDNVTDSLSLSITFPNYQMFYRCRQKTGGGASKWAIFLLNAGAVLSNFPCAFNYTNAASSEIKNLPLEKRKTLDAFKEMFYEPKDYSRANRNLSLNESTDPQAEILCLADIPIEYIADIIFFNQKSLEEHKALFPNTSCRVDSSYFTYRHDWSYWKKSYDYDFL